MKVTVVCFGAMKDYLPDGGSNSTALDLPVGATVREVLAALDAPPGLVHLCLVDGERAGLDRGLGEGSEVTLMPPFSGGA